MKFKLRYSTSNNETYKWFIDDRECPNVQSMMQYVNHRSSSTTGLRHNFITTDFDNSEQTELCWYQIFQNGLLVFEWCGSLIFGDQADKSIAEWQTITPDYQDYCFTLPNSVLTCYSRDNQQYFFAKGILYSGSSENNVNEWKNYLIFP